jgi:uncharacterized membrane protein
MRGSSMRWLITLTLFLAITAGAIAQGEEASFQGLGFLPGFEDGSEASAVSADGSTLVGSTFRDFSFPPIIPERREAFRWTAADGMVSLGDLPYEVFELIEVGFDVSADGSVVVGLRSGGEWGGTAFRWTDDEGMTELEAGTAALARGVSADGSVIVGLSTDMAAFRWTAAEGAVMLPHPADFAEPRGGANAVSADGSVVVSTLAEHGAGNSSTRAFRWTEATGTVALGDPPPGYDSAWAGDVSADGSVVAGTFKLTDGSTHSVIVLPPSFCHALVDIGLFAYEKMAES